MFANQRFPMTVLARKIMNALVILAIFSTPVQGSIGGRLVQRGSPPWRRNQSIESALKFSQGVPKIQEESCVSRMRGGRESNNFEQNVATVVDILASTCRAVLPPVVAAVRGINRFYRAMPLDAVIAQVGLVYCFAGGYYPTLFSALQAARYCGWDAMVGALDDLTEEAGAAIDAVASEEHGYGRSARDIFTEKTMVVLATVDPMKINQAVAALYTTWIGVSTVLEREYAKTITMSMTISSCLEPITNAIIAPPVCLCVPEQYQRWVPVVLGWACKAAAMSITVSFSFVSSSLLITCLSQRILIFVVQWRIQRVVTAYTSAVAGGLMFARACIRMLSKRGWKFFGLIKEDHSSWIDEFLGFLVGGLGLYTQVGNGFSFKVPFPLNLVTWPFDWAERWIQWQITKDNDS